jgi:hypothetical protein
MPKKKDAASKQAYCPVLHAYCYYALGSVPTRIEGTYTDNLDTLGAHFRHLAAAALAGPFEKATEKPSLRYYRVPPRLYAAKTYKALEAAAYAMLDRFKTHAPEPQLPGVGGKSEANRLGEAVGLFSIALDLGSHPKSVEAATDAAALLGRAVAQAAKIGHVSKVSLARAITPLLPPRPKRSPRSAKVDPRQVGLFGDEDFGGRSGNPDARFYPSVATAEWYGLRANNPDARFYPSVATAEWYGLRANNPRGRRR